MNIDRMEPLIDATPFAPGATPTADPNLDESAYFTLERHVLARLDTLWIVVGSEHAIDYWSFVRHCRRGEDHSRGGANPWYDVVVGPVARRWLDELRAYRHYDQVSFHTRLAAETLDQSNPRIVR
jgi:hypothetical protein